jgi:cobalt-zinc-cadmium resistance protein CzcA
LGIPGIADISSFGGYKKEYQAKIKPQRMKSLNITVDELFEALSKGNSNTGGAYIEKNNKAYTIRGIGLATSLEEIGNTVIKLNNNVPVLIKDVADVEFGHSIRYGAISMNGNGEVVGGIIMMMKGANGKEVIQNVKAKMKKIEADLPEGLMVEAFIDREKIISKSIKTVFTNLIEGALIVVLVIVVFLGNIRASLLVASVIPLSMLFAFILMRQFGVVGNLMSLGAIDFGLLVDSGIIIVESVILFLAVKMSGKPPGTKLTYEERQDVIINASKEVKTSVVYGGLIILIVYFPILTLSGIEGKMFTPMAQMVGFAILGALMLSITYLPMMSAVVLRPSKSIHDYGFSKKLVNIVYEGYEPLLKYAIRNKGKMIILALFIILSGGVGFSIIGGEFIPKLSEGDFIVEVRLPVGTSMTESLRLGEKLQKKLLHEFPNEIERVVSKIGISEIPVDPLPMEAQDLILTLTDKSLWKKAKDQPELASRIAESMNQIPGITYSIMQPIDNRVNDMMNGAKTDVVIKLYGKEIDTMVALSGKIYNSLKGIPGAVDLQEGKMIGLPQINVKYDRSKMAFYGVTVEQINRTIQTAYAGAVAGIIYENDKSFDLSLRLAGDERQRSQNLRNLLIEDKDGKPIPLHQLADIIENIGPAEIGHENIERKVNIGFNVRNRDMASVVEDAMKKLDRQVALPDGYRIEFGGAFENFTRAKERLSIAFPIALLVIFGLLYATFGNFKDSLLIYTVVPLSAIGGVFSLLIRDMNFSISAGVGFIALFGVAVLNGILLVSHFNSLEAAGITEPAKRILIGIRDKFRPVLMTTFVAALGFMPLAISTAPGAEIQKPLATVVIGGLFTSTALTLLVLPVLYILFKMKKEKGESLKKFVSKTAIIVFVISSVSVSQAQNSITRDQAINQAVTGNPEMMLSDQRIEQQNLLKGAAFNIPDLQAYFQSPTSTEQRLNLFQSIQYPGVYVAQVKTQKEKVKLSESEKKVTKNMLVYKVKTAFNETQFLIQKVDLLKQKDSIYSNIININEVRYRVGQISNLEKINGEAKYKEIEYNLRQAKVALLDAKIQLGLLLGKPNDSTYIPSEKLGKMSSDNIVVNDYDSSVYHNNPLIGYNMRLENVNRSMLKVERRKRVPGLLAGYLNQGPTHSTANYYKLQFGVTLPIWFWSYRSNVRSAKKGIEIAQTQSQITSYQLSTEYSRALAQFKQQSENINYFETVGLVQAKEIIKSARESYRLGSIGYYAFLQNIELAFQIEQNYLESLRNYNHSIIILNYITGQNQ